MRFFLSSFVNVLELACCRRSGGGEGVESYAQGKREEIALVSRQFVARALSIS